MLQLVTYPAGFGQPSASPFCFKAMCLLNMAGLEWEPIFTSDPRKMPMSKLPVLIDTGAKIADSDLIRQYIEQKIGFDFDRPLIAEQRAVSRSVIRMVEEHLYFALVCDRWFNDANWVVVKEVLFKDVPSLLRNIVANKVRKQAKAQAYGQGVARFTPAQQVQRAQADIEAISVLLGGKQYLFGDTLTAADATVMPMLCAVLGSPTHSPLWESVSRYKNLVDYVERAQNDLKRPKQLAAA